MAEVDGDRIRRQERRRRVRNHRHPIVGVIVLAMVLQVGAATAALLFTAPGRLASACDLGRTHPRIAGADSFVYTADGTRLGAVPTARNREPVPLGQVSRWLPSATVAIEDHRFWDHGALDYQGILRAAVADLRAHRVVQGGSTLTQQLVRARYMPGETMTLDRKLSEACLAVNLAEHSSRRRILQAYLNTVFYGHRAYGAQAAAITYFSRPAARLTLTQAALLAGLPQAPSIYDPLSHPKAALERRDAVLKAMRANRAISRRQLRRALARPLGLHPGRRYVSIHASGFFDVVVRRLGRRYGRRLRRAGLQVDTTLDWRLQRMADHALGRWLGAPGDPAGALVAIDPRTGGIRALETFIPGGRRMRFNLATQSHRQAGSAFKTFTLTTAVERGIPLDSVWNGPPSLTIPDRRCLNGINTPWVVHNFADESAGRMTLLSAFAHSVNTIFAQVALKAGLQHVVDVAHRLGIRSHLRPVCSITLGPEGVSPLEMTAAFATLAAGGIRHEPQAVRRLTARDGHIVHRRHRAGKRVIGARTARTVTYALTGVIKGGTGMAADPGRPAAGKTGTAEHEKDAWFCGFVPQLAACVWIGYPRAEVPMTSVAGFSPVVGGSVPARIWHDFMVPALQRVPVIGLPTVRGNAVTPLAPAGRAPVAGATQPPVASPR
jgi:penicillin-binding protein 1A